MSARVQREWQSPMCSLVPEEQPEPEVKAVIARPTPGAMAALKAHEPAADLVEEYRATGNESGLSGGGQPELDAHLLSVQGGAGIGLMALVKGRGPEVSPRAVQAGADLPPRTGNAFIDRVSADAIQSQRETGVPASVTIAQAILESGWGKSGLATRANNFFGIKGEGPAGHVTMRTREVSGGREVYVNADFRRYSTSAESFIDHGRLLRDNPRYAEAFKHTGNAERFAAEIHKAGYATDPSYTKLLTRIVQQHGLGAFDKLAESVPSLKDGASGKRVELLAGPKVFQALNRTPALASTGGLVLGEGLRIDTGNPILRKLATSPLNGGRTGYCVATTLENMNRLGVPNTPRATGSDPNNPRGGLVQMLRNGGWASVPLPGSRQQTIHGNYGTATASVVSAAQYRTLVSEGKIPDGAIIFQTRHGWDWNAGSSGNDMGIVRNHGQTTHNYRSMPSIVYPDCKDVVLLVPRDALQRTLRRPAGRLEQARSLAPATHCR